uniref:Uncharacterized protein n=1 Tax=Ditylenchus dipsaci TaxID=166011 RepID=A0A915EPA2_9BILA
MDVAMIKRVMSLTLTPMVTIINEDSEEDAQLTIENRDPRESKYRSKCKISWTWWTKSGLSPASNIDITSLRMSPKSDDIYASNVVIDDGNKEEWDHTPYWSSFSTQDQADTPGPSSSRSAQASASTSRAAASSTAPTSLRPSTTSVSAAHPRAAPSSARPSAPSARPSNNYRQHSYVPITRPVPQIKSNFVM